MERRASEHGRPLGWALIALGGILAANSVLGPLVEAIRYRF
jgi:hypothetical protein